MHRSGRKPATRHFRLLGPLLAMSLVMPADVLAQQPPAPPPVAPWGMPGLPFQFPNPFPQPAPSQGAPSIPGFPVLPSAPIAQAGSPVVLELFTSMDCAMCEDAEYEMNRLMTTQPVAGVRLIPLAYHVEFYGGTSGTDPYVLPASTARQQEYDSARGRVYTPQAIVDGDHEFTGSNDSAARTAIAAAAMQRKVSVDVSRAARFVGPTQLALSVRYGASGGRGRTTLTAVLVENGLLELHHGGHTDYDRVKLTPVVRSMQVIGSASAGGGSLEATVAIPPAAVRANVTAVVLLQDAATHHVLGVGTLPAGVL